MTGERKLQEGEEEGEKEEICEDEDSRETAPCTNSHMSTAVRKPCCSAS